MLDPTATSTTKVVATSAVLVTVNLTQGEVLSDHHLRVLAAVLAATDPTEVGGHPSHRTEFVEENAKRLYAVMKGNTAPDDL